MVARRHSWSNSRPQKKALAWSIALYVLNGACWLPVVWLQLRMRDLARHAAATGQVLPARYWRLLWIWVALGVPALVAMLAVFYLMVNKPTLG